VAVLYKGETDPVFKSATPTVRGRGMRPRRRHIAFEVLGAKLSRSEATRAILNSLRGSSDFVDVGVVRLILYDAGSGLGLLRCGHKQVTQARAAMAKLKRIGGEEVSFNVLGVSGTIRAAKRKFLAPPKKLASSQR